MAMTGFTASVVRAGIMQIFMLLAPVFGRERDDITSLSEATFILLVINPYACAGVSLQLSFGATLGILLFSGKIYKAVISPINARIKKRRIITAPLGFIFSSLSTTFSALIFTLPMCAYYFGTVSLAAPLTNLLILWAVSLCFSLGLISCAVGFVFMAPATVIAAVCTLFSKYVLFFINLLGGSYASAVYTTNPAVVIWLVYIYAMFIAFFVFRGSLRRMLLPATLAVVYLCAVIIITPFANVSSTLDITALDVGQGQCLVITCGSYTAVVDCGSSSGEDAGEIAGRYLAGIGRQNIDMLILTHFHSDHSSGVEQLLEYADVSCLVVPSVGTSSQEGDEIISLAIEHNIDVIYVTRDISVSFSDAVFNIIAPMGSSTENERGLTILASRDEYDILITGDMPESIEEKLAAAFDLPDIELLIVGHHGSKYSSCDELLDAVKPEKAIISVGYNNYGHPTQETLQRLSERGIEIYRTDLIGNVSISQW
jgi:competence protein ComEC